MCVVFLKHQPSWGDKIYIAAVARLPRALGTFCQQLLCQVLSRRRPAPPSKPPPDVLVSLACPALRATPESLGLPWLCPFFVHCLISKWGRDDIPSSQECSRPPVEKLSLRFYRNGLPPLLCAVAHGHPGT